MNKYIPLNKRSKKAQKEYHKQQRGTWEINPVTRSVPNGKGYDRNKIKQQDRRGGRLSGKNDSLPFSYVSRGGEKERLSLFCRVLSIFF